MPTYTVPSSPTPAEAPLTFWDKLRKSARDVAINIWPFIIAGVYDFVQSNPLEGTRWAVYGAAFASLYAVVADAVRRHWFPPKVETPSTFV